MLSAAVSQSHRLASPASVVAVHRVPQAACLVLGTLWDDARTSVDPPPSTPMPPLREMIPAKMMAHASFLAVQNSGLPLLRRLDLTPRLIASTPDRLQFARPPVP